MILRRIINILRQQNCTAVALEFVIVAAGGLLGFQLSEWNAQRQNRERQVAYIQMNSVVVEVVEGALKYVEWLSIEWKQFLALGRGH